MQALPIQKMIIYVKVAFAATPKVGKKILAKLLSSLGKKHTKHFDCAPLGDIFKVDDAHFPKVPQSTGEDGEPLELSESA